MQITHIQCIGCVCNRNIWLKVDKSNLFEIMRQVKLDETATSFESGNESSKTLRNPLESRGKVDYIDIIKGAQESCVLDLERKLRFPECDEKIEWMQKHWNTHKCYKDSGNCDKEEIEVSKIQSRHKDSSQSSIRYACSLESPKSNSRKFHRKENSKLRSIRYIQLNPIEVYLDTFHLLTVYRKIKVHQRIKQIHI